MLGTRTHSFSSAHEPAVEQRPLPASTLYSDRPLRIRFGERLRKLRRTQMYTQKQLAEYLGIDRSFISDIERGKKNLSLNVAETIAQGFHLSLSDLLRDL